MELDQEQKFIQIVWHHLNQLSNGQLENKNRYHRVLMSDDEQKLLKCLASIYDHRTIPDNVYPIYFSLQGGLKMTIFEEIAFALHLYEEWESLKQTKKLHESELEIFERLLIKHNKTIYLMMMDFQEVYKSEFTKQQSMRILEQLAEIINSFQGLFFCVVCGKTILNDLLFAHLPKDQINDYPNYTHRDMNKTKLRTILLDK